MVSSLVSSTGHSLGGLWTHGPEGLHGGCSNPIGRFGPIEHCDWLVQVIHQLLIGQPPHLCLHLHFTTKFRLFNRERIPEWLHSKVIAKVIQLGQGHLKVNCTCRFSASIKPILILIENIVAVSTQIYAYM